MSDITILNQEKDGIHSTLSNKINNQKLESNEIDNNSKYTLTSKSFGDSLIKGEEDKENRDNEDNINYKEKQLSLLLDTFQNSFSKKSYRDLIKDIEEKEDLLSQNSLMSFEIKILKLKGLLKILTEEYNIFLQSKNKHFHELDVLIQKIKNEFNLISILLIYNEAYVFEITTQIYSKFLYLLAKISIKKEDFLKSLGYVTLGINILKIYFIKKKVASNIKTYKIYCKLVIELINILIGDQNYEQALYYIRLLFKIIEISIKFMYNIDKTSNKKIPIATIKKFLTFGAIGYIYTGCCLEKLDDSIQAFEAYKQAKYFFKKGSKLGISFQNLNSISINNSCSFLAEEVFEKLKLKFERDKIDRLNTQKRLEMQRKKEEYELLQNEKSMKLKYIASGLGSDPFKLEAMENKLNKKIFPSSVVNNLEKIDDELTSFVFSYFHKNKKDNISSYNNKMSTNTKKNLSRYKIYNILMSKNFREFIMKNEKLQFYNPKTGSNSISIFQRHLNNKMKIESKSKKMSVTPRKSLKLITNFTESSKTDRRLNTNDNFFSITTSPNSQRENEKIKDKIFYFQRQKIKFRNNDLKFLLSKENANTERNSKKKINLSSNFTKSLFKKKFKLKLNKNYNELESDFERKNMDKNLMTKNYLRKYAYYDKLSDKELKFQKEILHFKYNNTLYNKTRTIEEKDGIIGKDDLANISLIINEKAKAKPVVDKNVIQLNLIKDSFGTKQNQISMKMKSAMSSVISKYISERKSRVNKQSLIDSDRIKKLNVKELLILDNSIRNINNNISQMKFFIAKNN